ncbi:flagellar hook-length control protein FliK [Nocardioides marmoriginsengisoli]|uniref:Flagellar hook-length control protein FliK n=1 Tax=Nocardioides marmoriginsengisoli TaxID=661483 RepID=A0A3N0CI70_9ACTN|nr:flagellar hook-length control protein FliK [Nocardioides marmoriginsengisoli]
MAAAGGEVADAAPGDFLAALLNALGSPGPDAQEPDGEPAEMPVADGQALAGDPPLIAQVVAPVVAPAPASDTVCAEHANVTGGTPGIPTDPTSDIRRSVYDGNQGEPAGPPVPAVSPARPPAGAEHANVTGETVGVPTDPISDIRRSVYDGAGDEPAGTPASAPATPANGAAIQPAQPSGTAAPVPSVLAPVAPTTASAAPTAPSAQLDRVSAQVFPEVTGLVSRGNGTHRITLTLNPEHLGEVRVVMTMRAGAVHVRLAAGQEAQASLVEGSPELGRLLERAGATDARVVVRDLPNAAPAPTTGSTGASFGAGSDRPTDQHAGTRADHPARDGDRSPRQHREPVLPEVRSTQPVSGPRLAGVDLTM